MTQDAERPRSPFRREPTSASRTSRWRVVRRFTWRYLEMVVAMFAGMILLGPPLDALAGAFDLDLDRNAAPVASAMVMTMGMAAGMAAWMWYRGYPPAHVALMSAAMFPPAIVTGALVGAGLVTAETGTMWSHASMMALMLALMLHHADAHLRPAPRRTRVRHLLRFAAAATLAIALPVGIAGIGISRQVAAAYGPPPVTASANPHPRGHDPNMPTAVIVVGMAGAEVGDVLGPYETLAATKALNVYTVAPEHGPVPLTGGLDLAPDLTFAELQQRLGPAGVPDVVVVPAMPNSAQPSNAPVVDWIRRQHRGGTVLLGVCNGARILAAAELLDGRSATSHWIRLAGLQDAYPQVRWRADTRYVDSGDIITTGGILSGIDGSLRVVERLLGPGPADETARAIGWRHYTPGAPARLPASSLTPSDLIAALNAGYRWHRPTLGILLTDGVGELELVSVFDPYAGQSFAVDTLAVALEGPVRTRHALTLLPRSSLADAAPRIDRLVVPGHATSRDRTSVDDAARAAGLTPHYLHSRFGFPLDAGLRDLAATVDVPTAEWAAKMLEYPTADLALDGPGWPWRLTATPVLTLIGTFVLITAGSRILRRPHRRGNLSRRPGSTSDREITRTPPARA